MAASEPATAGAASHADAAAAAATSLSRLQAIKSAVHRIAAAGRAGEQPTRDLANTLQLLADLSKTFRQSSVGVHAEQESIETSRSEADAHELKLANLQSQKAGIHTEIARCKHLATAHLDSVSLPTADQVAAEGGEPLPSDPHARTLAQLRHELQRRKELLQACEDSAAAGRAKRGEVEAQQAFLGSLPAHLDSLKAAAAPLGQFLQVDWPALQAQASAMQQLPPPMATAFRQLLAVQNERVPVPGHGSIAGTVTEVTVRAVPQDILAHSSLSEEAVPPALRELLEQFDREASEGESPAKPRRLGYASSPRARTALPATAAAAFVPHSRCIQVVVCIQGAVDAAASSTSVRFLLLWLPHLHLVTAAPLDGQNSLQGVFPADSGATIPLLRSPPMDGGADHASTRFATLPFPAALPHRPFVWASALAGLLPLANSATQPTPAVEFLKHSLVPTTRSIVAALALRLLRDSAVHSHVQALVASCGKGLAPASPAVQSAVRRIRAALQTHAQGSSVPPAAQLISVRVVEADEAPGRLAELFAASDVSELASRLQRSTVWQGGASAEQSPSRTAPSKPQVTAAFEHSDEWILGEAEGAPTADTKPAPTRQLQKADAPPSTEPTCHKFARLVFRVGYTHVQALVSFPALYPASFPSVSIQALDGPSDKLSLTHATSTPLHLVCLLDDVAGEASSSFLPDLRAQESTPSTPVADVAHFLQTAIPIACHIADTVSGQGQDSLKQVWQGALSGKARKLALARFLQLNALHSPGPHCSKDFAREEYSRARAATAPVSILRVLLWPSMASKRSARVSKRTLGALPPGTASAGAPAPPSRPGCGSKEGKRIASVASGLSRVLPVAAKATESGGGWAESASVTPPPNSRRSSLTWAKNSPKHP